MKLEEEKKAKGLNDKEKRQVYFNQIRGLEKEVYDKAYINDNLLDYSYLHDRKNYMLLMSHKYRPFFLKPFYAKRTDFNESVPARVWALRIFGSLLLLKVGYEFGVLDGAYLNKKIAQSKVIDMETEEEIYHHLYNKNRTAVFI